MLELLNKNEILRYLGSRQNGLNPRIEELLERCMDETRRICQGKYIYRRFPVVFTDQGVEIPGTGICMTGKDIRDHLESCRDVYLLCATAGVELDKRIRRWMITEPDAGVVLDACGIQAVEQIADMAEREIEKAVQAEGKNITWRFSPGYGDMPLELQRDFIRVLDTYRKIGVSLSESFLMIPSKSVTAVIGVADTARDKRKNKCDHCNNRDNCSFRKRGTIC